MEKNLGNSNITFNPTFLFGSFLIAFYKKKNKVKGTEKTPRTYYWHFILMISGAVVFNNISLKWGNVLTFRNRKNNDRSQLILNNLESDKPIDQESIQSESLFISYRCLSGMDACIYGLNYLNKKNTATKSGFFCQLGIVAYCEVVLYLN
jgi:hypothetical protein